MSPLQCFPSDAIPRELKKSFHPLLSSMYWLKNKQIIHLLCTYDMYRSILGHPSLYIDDSLHTVEHGLAQHVEALGSVLGIISFLFRHIFSLSSPISPKRIKIGTCSCTQNAHLEILFPAVINFLSFHCKKIGKIDVKSLLSRFYQLFFPHQLQSRIFHFLTSTQCIS